MGHIGWLAKPSLKTLAGLFVPLTGNGPVLVFVYSVVCGYALLYAAIQRRSSDARFIPSGYAFLVTWLWLPVLGSFIFSILWKPIFYSRYLIISLPPLVLIAAAGIQPPPVWLKTTALVFFLALSSRGLVDLLTEAGRIELENWRMATAYVLDNSKTGDGVIFKEAYARKPFEYYLQAIRPQAKVPKPVSPAAPWGECQSRQPGQQAVISRGAGLLAIMAGFTLPTTCNRRLSLAPGKFQKGILFDAEAVFRYHPNYSVPDVSMTPRRPPGLYRVEST
jgi:hypothetical protein